jgi:hypothetical protein
VNYIRLLCGERNPDIDKLMEKGKTLVINDYEKKNGKPLSGEEKQVFDDIYKVIIKRKNNRMRIGHQLFEFLRYYTDIGSYSAQETESFKDAEGRCICIMEMYINEEENQVYLVIEDENQNQFHKSVNEFIKMMGGPRPDSYAPLYQLRDETTRVKKAYIHKYLNALKKYDPKERKVVKQILKKLYFSER